MARVFTTSNTHLYVGARLLARAGGPLRRGAVLAIEFSDLGVAEARVEAVGAGRLTLAVSAHRTRRGTLVAARRWTIEKLPTSRADDRPTYRVVGGRTLHRVRATR